VNSTHKNVSELIELLIVQFLTISIKNALLLC